MIEPNTLHQMDWLDLLRALPDGSVDALITDPPYGIGLDEWDKPIDVHLFIQEAWRVVKESGFLAFFHQMPKAMDWLAPLHLSEWKMKDHIVWVKRVPSGIACELLRAHESFYIYAKGKAEYAETKGYYEDVRLPGLLFDTVTIDGIDRYIKDLQIKANGQASIIYGAGKKHSKYQYMPITSNRSPEKTNFTNVWSFIGDTRKGHTFNASHASIKPMAFLQRACELMVPNGGLIVDPFLGSGTTAVAAKTTGRNFICGDQSAEYIEIARRRVFPEFGKPPKRTKPELALSDLPLFAALV